MHTCLFFSSILAVAHIASAVPYEDDPRFFIIHHASQMTDVGEIIFVTLQSRHPLLRPQTPCQAMRKLRRIEDEIFRYKVYYTNPGLSTTTRVFTTTLTTSESDPHYFDNVVAYQTFPWGPFYPYKVMYADRRSGCLILVLPHVHLGRGCRLLQTAYTVRRPIPEECLNIYRRNCPVQDNQVFLPACYWQVVRSGI